MEKQLVPKLRFPEFQEVWHSKTLSDISNNVGYGIGSSAVQFDGINKYLRITDIDESSNKFSPKPLTSPEGEISNKYYLKEGDIVFARTGASVGKSYIYDEKDGVIVYAGFLIKFSINKAEPKFIFYNTLTSQYWKWVQVMSMRSGQPGLNAEELKSFIINLPSLPEQQKIASFLSDVDEVITKLTKKKTLLEQYKKGVMQKIFNQELRFKDDNGNEFPKWIVKKLGGITTVNMGQSPDSVSYNTNGDGYYLIQGNADISNRKTSPRNWTSAPTKLCDIGDLILTVRAPVGAIAKSNHKACIGRGVCSIKNKKTSNIEFIYQFLLDYEKRWARLEQGSTFTAVSGKEIKSIEINLPSIEEQTKIANFLSDIDIKIEALTTKIENSTTFKKGLLQQMFV